MKHESQYTNATDLADGVASLGVYIAQQINGTAPTGTWYAEGFTPIAEMG